MASQALLTPAAHSGSLAGCILVCVDGSRMSHKAFDAAVHFASTNDLPIAVLHVADPDKSHLPGHFDPNFLMFQFERKLINSGHKKYQLMVVDKEGRDVVHVIDDVSAKHHPKYLVLGQFGRKGISAFAHGSNTDWSVRGNPVDTVIVKQAATKLDVPDTANVFLVCVDGSTSMTARVLQSAEGVIRPQDEVIVFHIADPDVGSKFGTGVVGSAASVRTKAQEELARKADAVKSVDTKELQTTVEALTLPNGKTWKESMTKYRFHVVNKDVHRTVAQEICKVATEVGADVIVLGVDGMSAYLDGHSVMGSVSDAVVREARRTIILAKRPGWKPEGKKTATS